MRASILRASGAFEGVRRDTAGEWWLSARVPLGALAGLVVAVVLAGCGGQQTSTTVQLSPYRLDEVSAWGFSYRGVSGWLVSRDDGGVDAFWVRSPHLGCAVHPMESDQELERGSASGLGGESPMMFFDPCSNSRWDFSGERLFGPAPRGLDRFDATLTAHPQGDEVTIQLDSVRLGTCSPGGDVPCSPPGESMYIDGPPLYDWP